VDLLDLFDARSTYYFKIAVIDPFLSEIKESLNNSSMKRNKNMTMQYDRKGMQTVEIKIAITEITRNGEATVKFFKKN
jgi:hypothetical protein